MKAMKRKETKILYMYPGSAIYLSNVRRREIFNENVSAAVKMKAGKKDVNPGNG